MSVDVIGYALMRHAAAAMLMNTALSAKDTRDAA